MVCQYARPMAQATVAEEEYLQTMFWLEEAGLQINGRTSPARCSSPRPRSTR